MYVSCQKILPSNFRDLIVYVLTEYESVMDIQNLAFFAPPYNYRTAMIFLAFLAIYKLVLAGK